MLSEQQLTQVGTLVSKFHQLSPNDLRRYQETEVRTNFIDPLFAILGWRMDDRAYVERETTVEEGKRPDYAFKIAGVPRLFLEAKPFRDDIYDHNETRKAITKAYNRGVPWVGVTNFARLVLYDAQEELRKGQPQRVVDLMCDDYQKSELDAGLHLLAHSSVEFRTLDEYAQRVGARRRGVPIEKRLYESMRSWRETLFNALQSVKQWKTEAEFRVGDEAIQRLLDRLIFLRNCEDRFIGGTDLRGLRNRIRSRSRSVHVTEGLLQVFGQAEAIYDSELFQTDAIIDVLMRGMGTILDDTIAEIVEQLYSVPKSYSDYDFSQMEPDVLGQVYEQYLEYVPERMRRLASQPSFPGIAVQEIELEAKRQRRKEHGIYYTPRWVVQDIVRETLGRFLGENADRPEAIEELTILDPACGSGSFLIRAYETLLEYHASRLGVDISNLDTRTRERILRRSIYGVDLDPQAVEIARLNLLIRMVRQQELLPELKANLQHGNSLIDGDAKALHPFFGDRWEDKHPFDWKKRFPDIMSSGGFDIVIGNPPYVGFHGFKEDKSYLRERFATARGRFDLYIPFVERAFTLLKPGGLFGFICPTNFMKREHGKDLRDLLREDTSIVTVVDFQDQQAFEGALNYTGILIFRKGAPPPGHVLRYSYRDDSSAYFEVPQDQLTSAPWVFRRPDSDELVRKAMEVQTSPLGDLAESIAEGIVTGKNDVFVLAEADVARRGIEGAVTRRIARGRSIRRYLLNSDGTYLIYPYVSEGDKTIPIDEARLRSYFPNAYSYLSEQRQRLAGRGYFDRSSKVWYELWCERSIGDQQVSKLVTPELSSASSFAIAPPDVFYLDTACGLTLRDDVRESPLFLLGLLNSKWANYYYRNTTVPKANGFLIYKTMYLRNFPVRRIDFADAGAAAAHDLVVRKVERTLELHQRLADKQTVVDYEREQLEREVSDIDDAIDAVIFDLYSLSASDRALVESSFAVATSAATAPV